MIASAQLAPPVPAAAPQLAPFALLRVAAVDYLRLARLAPPRTSTHVARALVGRAAMARVQSTLEDLLHALIPLTLDRRVRGDVLALKRDVHNGRRPTAGVPERVRDLLAPPDRATLDEWLAAQAQLSTELAAAEAALDEEIDTHVRGGLRRFVEDESFMRALALATPDLCEQIQREDARPPTGREPSRSDRSLLRYAVRAAAKTSPFSSFMHQGGVAVLPDGGETIWEAQAATRSARAQISRGLLARIYRAAITNHADASAPLFRVNSTLRARDAERIDALTGEYVVFDERTWRTETVGAFRFHPSVVALLAARAGADISRAELIEGLGAAGIERTRAASFMAKLVERGLIWELPWTDALDPAPEARVIANLQTSSGPEIETIREAVAGMATLASEFARTDGRGRVALLPRVDGLVERALTAAGVQGRARQENYILEDGALLGLGGAIGGPLARQLEAVGKLVGQRIEIAPEYAVMRERFLRTFGRAGRCTDVVRFLLDVAREPLAGPSPRAGDGAGVFHAEAPRAGVTMFLQLAAPDARTAAAGAGTIVLNQVLDRVGWIAARHAAGDHPEQAQLRTWLTTWLVQAMHPREPIDILGRGECSNLQAHPALTRRVLGWPSEPIRPGTSAVVPLERCTLVHDEATGYLELRDPDGRPLAPVYLGTVISTGFGLMNLLLLLAQPFQVRRPPPSPPPTGAGEMVVFRPRTESDGIVLRRGTWWVRSRHLRAVWFAHAGARRLLDVAADRAAHGIPECFFAQLNVPMEADRFAALGKKHRKPLWVDTRNPFSLELLERLAVHGQWVMLREMLPDAAGLVTQIGGASFVSEIHAEMMLPVYDAGAPAEASA